LPVPHSFPGIRTFLADVCEPGSPASRVAERQPALAEVARLMTALAALANDERRRRDDPGGHARLEVDYLRRAGEARDALSAAAKAAGLAVAAMGSATGAEDHVPPSLQPPRRGRGPGAKTRKPRPQADPTGAANGQDTATVRDGDPPYSLLGGSGGPIDSFPDTGA